MIQHPHFIKAALTADAYNLGPHWVYNQSKLARAYPQGISGLSAPLSKYHTGKNSGDFTHYGDNLALILRSYALTDHWDHSLFTHSWQSYWQNTRSYQDSATKDTLAHLEKPQTNPPSSSNDISGAAMALALLSFLDLSNPDHTITTIRQQTAFTHGDPEVVSSAEFFTRAILEILNGQTIPAALEHAAQHTYPALDAASYFAKAQAALTTSDHLEVAAKLGLTCHHPEAFPLTLYYLLRNPDNLIDALNENALAGGDNSARAIIIAIIHTTSHGWNNHLQSLWQNLTQYDQLNALLPSEETPTRQPLTFPNQSGDTLHATLELPPGKTHAYAIFAHCFTCGQSSRAATRITTALAQQGIATLRFDFTGLGRSEGTFSQTSFLTNTQDLVAAAQHLSENFSAPSLLIGHSLGGAAVLATAHQLPSVTAVATIGAPADPAHVEHLFAEHLDEINSKGIAEVTLAGRPFQIGKRFLDDVKEHCQACEIRKLNRDLLIMHSPTDEIVGIENAASIYAAALHPKSFISLTESDHLLIKPRSAEQAADLISAWAKRSIPS